MQDELAKADLAIKQEELERLRRDVRKRPWVSSVAVPLLTVLVSVGGSSVIARSAARDRDRAFTADLLRTLAGTSDVHGFRSLELLLASGLVTDPHGMIDRAVSVLRPRAATELAEEGRQLMMSGSTDSVPRAVRLFRAALEIDSVSLENRFLLAHALWNVGRLQNSIPYFEESVEQFEMVHEAAPSNVQYRSWLGRAYMSTRRYDDARPLFASIVQDPMNRPLQVYRIAEEQLAIIDARPAGR